MRYRLRHWGISILCITALTACTSPVDTTPVPDVKTTVPTTSESWELYRNDEYHYQIRRPESWSVRGYENISAPIYHLTGFDPLPLPAEATEFAGTVAIQVVAMPIDDVIDEQRSLTNFEMHGVSINQVVGVQITGQTAADSLHGVRDIDYILFDGGHETLMLMGTFMPDDADAKAIFRRMAASFRLH